MKLNNKIKEVVDMYLENMFGYDEKDIKKYVDVGAGVIVKKIDGIIHILKY